MCIQLLIDAANGALIDSDVCPIICHLIIIQLLVHLLACAAFTLVPGEGKGLGANLLYMHYLYLLKGVVQQKPCFCIMVVFRLEIRFC